MLKITSMLIRIYSAFTTVTKKQNTHHYNYIHEQNKITGNNAKHGKK